MTLESYCLSIETAPHCSLLSSPPGATNGNTRALSGCLNVGSMVESVLSRREYERRYHRGFFVLLLSCALVPFFGRVGCSPEEP